MTFLVLYTKTDATYIATDLIEYFVVEKKRITRIAYKDTGVDNDLNDVVKWELI